MTETSSCLVYTALIQLIIWTTLSYERLALEETVTWVLWLLANIRRVSYMARCTSHHLILRWHQLCKVESATTKLFKTTSYRLVVNRGLCVWKSHQWYLLSMIQTHRHMSYLAWQRLIQILVGLISAGERHRRLLLIDLLQRSCMLIYSSSLATLYHTEIFCVLASPICCSFWLWLSSFSRICLAVFWLVLNTTSIDHLIVSHQGVELLLDDSRIVQIIDWAT